MDKTNFFAFHSFTSKNLLDRNYFKLTKLKRKELKKK